MDADVLAISALSLVVLELAFPAPVRIPIWEKL
jgi:hypothetical protein